MTRCALLAAFIATALWSSIGGADEPSKMPRVGILSPAANEATPIFEAFRRGLREFGYVEGRDIILEYRFAHGDSTALRRLADAGAQEGTVVLSEGKGSRFRLVFPPARVRRREEGEGIPRPSVTARLGADIPR